MNRCLIAWLLLLAMPSVSADQFGAYDLIQCDGTSSNRRGTLNFISGTCTDDSSNNATKVEFAASSGDVTAVGNCTTGACFAGASGTTLTPTGGTLIIVSDVEAQDASPHYSLKPTTGDQYGLHVDPANSVFFMNDETDGKTFLLYNGRTDKLSFPDNAGCTSGLGTTAQGVAFCVPAGAGSGSVTSIAQGTGMSFSTDPITTSGTINLATPVAVANGGTGATTLVNLITLATHTTGNYVATVADEGSGTVTVSGSGAENAAVTLKIVDLACTNCIGPTEITDLALGTDTSGNYAAGDAEAGAALTGDTATAFFSLGTLEHERGGLEADVSAYDGLVGITGGAAYNQTGTTTQIIIFDGAGAPTSAALSGDATMTNGGVVTIAANAVALGTDTTNAYVTDLTAGTYMDVSGGGAETATVTVDMDPTEMEAVTFGAGGNASNAWTFNLSGTDPLLTAVSNGFQIQGTLALTGIAGPAYTMTPSGGGDTFGWHSENGPGGGVSFIADSTDGTHFIEFSGQGNGIYLPTMTAGTECTLKTTKGQKLFCGTDNTGGGGSGSPAGSGSELQYRVDVSTFGAVTGSSVSGGSLTLTGNLVLSGAVGINLTMTSTGADQLGIHTESGANGGTWWLGNDTDGKKMVQGDGLDNLYFPQLPNCALLATLNEGKTRCDTYTAGSLLFAGTATSVAQNNAQLFWQNTADNYLLKVGDGNEFAHVKINSSEFTPLSTATKTLEIVEESNHNTSAGTLSPVGLQVTFKPHRTEGSNNLINTAALFTSAGAQIHHGVLLDPTLGVGYSTIPTSTLPFTISLRDSSGGGATSPSIGISRQETAGFAGDGLTMQAGGALSGDTNISGGSMTVASGIATGNGSSTVIVQTVAGSQGSGTTDRSPVTSATFSGGAVAVLTLEGGASDPALTAGNGTLTLNADFALAAAGNDITLNPPGGDIFGWHAESGANGGTSWWGNDTEGKRVMQVDGLGKLYFPQTTSAAYLMTDGQGTLNAGTFQGVPSYSNLRIVPESPTASVVRVTADSLTLLNTSNAPQIVRSVSVRMAITASGVNGLDTGAESSSTWYYLWIIAPLGGAPAGLLSTSSTAPTMPTGYTFKMRVGSVRNDGSSNFVTFEQQDRTCLYQNSDAIGGVNRVLNSGTASSFTTVSGATLIPPTTRLAYLDLQTDNASASTCSCFTRTTGSGAATGLRSIATEWKFDQDSNEITMTDSSQQFDYFCEAICAVDIGVRGYAETF